MTPFTAPVFRKAELKDLDLLIAMMGELYANDHSAFNVETSRRAALELMNEPMLGVLWVVELNGVTAGYAVLTFGFALEYGGRYGLIDELFVAAPYRGRELGTAAVRFLRSECARSGITALLLEADLANEKAIRLYRRLGFTENRRRLMKLRVS